MRSTKEQDAAIRAREVARIGFCLDCDHCGAVIAHDWPRWASHGRGVWCEDCGQHHGAAHFMDADEHAFDSMTDERDLYLCVGACREWCAKVNAKQKELWL